MRLAVVAGYMVCTVRHGGLTHDKLLIVKMLNARDEPDGQCTVVIDNIGTGCGEWVLLVSGSSARRAHVQGVSPADLCVIGVVDEAVADGQALFHKQGEKS